MKKILLTSALVSATAIGAAFANTNAAGELYVCATPQNDELDLAGYELLTWVKIGGLGSHGEAGSSTNILTYDTWDDSVMDKAKGMTNAGDPVIELTRRPTDAGQIILRAIALTNQKYAFKMLRNDQITGGQPTTIYNRGLVTGPVRPFGRNEDFDLENFTLALVQREIVVNPTGAGTAPVLTANPAITGTATVGQVLTLSNGTFSNSPTSYEKQWYAGGVPIAGATSGTYLLTAAETGKIITGRVRAVNAAGAAVAFSAPTTAVS